MGNEQYRELARRIMASLISYRLNLSSVDSTLKDYIGDQNVGTSWLKFAEDLDRRVSKEFAKSSKPAEAISDTALETTVIKV